MNCNCNNINNTDGSGLTAYVSHVYGNVLRLAIPLTLRTVTMENGEMVATDTDFIPSSDYPVTVVFSKEGVKISLEATMQNGNIAYIEDFGTIPVGKYDIAVLCKDDNGNPYRFKQVTALHVVDATADANIPSDIEYEVTTWYLDAAIFLALKGEDGVGIDDIITESSGEIGGMNTVTIVLTNGETRTFTVMNGSGQVDGDFNINSPHPLSNSTITAKFNAIDSSIDGLFGGADYDSQSKTIRFYNKDRSRVLATLDARPFIKDGMVNSVYISNNTLVITFNTDAGREAIGVSLSSIFNPNNYYTKTQVNNLLGNYYNKDVIDNLVRNNAALLDDGRLGNLQSSPIVLDGMYWDNDEWPDGVAGDYYKVYHTTSRDKHEIVLYKWINDGTVVRQVRVYRDVDPTAIYYDKDSETFYRYDMVEDDFVEIETGGGYEPPVGGIPKSDLSQSVQASLSKADTALQSQKQADWDESDSSDPAYIKNKPTIPDVSNLATKSELQSKADASDVYTKLEVDNALALKQGNITDLEQIREGATRGVTAYQKPYGGIPASDLADGVIPDVSGFVTSSDVADAVADLVDSAPSTLDTLNELAAALGDDPNFATTITTALGNKVDKVSGKGLSSNDYTDAEKTKLAGLSNYDDTALQAAVAGKVDKESGKSLMTDAEHTKLAGIASGAEANVQADWEQTTTTADDYIKNKPDVPTSISVNQQSFPLNNNHAFVIPDYYTKEQMDSTLADKANTDDLADVATSGSYNDLSNKPTIPAAQVNADWNASSGVMEILNKPTIPTKFSDLVDDSDYIKAEDVASIVVGSADVVITETPSHICITFVTTSISFTPNTTMSLWAGQKVGTLTVSGTHLKQDITLTVPSNFTAQVSGGTAAQSITIPQTGGEVTGVSVTITYTGADTGSYNGSITATSGSTTESVGLVYSQYQGATIIAGTIGTIKAAMGGSQIGELNVSGVNLEGDITASVGSGDFTICATQNGTYGSTATISKSSAEASGGATLYVKYTPSSGTSTASGTLTLTTPKDGSTTTESVSLSGKVAGTLSITPSTGTIGIASGGSGTTQFTVQGTYLTPASTASVAVSGTGMSADKQSLTVGQDGTINEVVTVTFSGSADSNGTLTVSHTDVDNDATASIAGVITTPLPVDAEFQVGKLKYKVLSGQSTVSVAQISSSATTGDIVIPSTVNDSGVTATLTDSSTQLGVGCTYTVTTIASSGFSGNKNITSLVLPNTITTMGVNGIRDLSNNGMTSFVIPNSVTSISANNLYGMTKLTSLTIGSGVTVLPDYFMGSCEAMRSITIPNNITEIKSYAFAKNTTTSFTDVDLGTGLTKIGANSYFSMTDDGVVTIRYTGGVISIGGAAFRNTSGGYPTTATLYVPSSLVETYKTAPGFGVNNGGGWHLFDPNNIYAIQE